MIMHQESQTGRRDAIANAGPTPTPYRVTRSGDPLFRQHAFPWGIRLYVSQSVAACASLPATTQLPPTLMRVQRHRSVKVIV